MKFKILQNLGEIIDYRDDLSSIELEIRDKLIEKGLDKCKDLIRKPESRDMYFFYEGSIEGFGECKNLTKFKAYETRLQELNQEEIREISLDSLGSNDEKTRYLREELHIYDSKEKADWDEIWRIKGRKLKEEIGNETK